MDIKEENQKYRSPEKKKDRKEEERISEFLEEKEKVSFCISRKTLIALEQKWFFMRRATSKKLSKSELVEKAINEYLPKAIQE